MSLFLVVYEITEHLSQQGPLTPTWSSLLLMAAIVGSLPAQGVLGEELVPSGVLGGIKIFLQSSHGLALVFPSVGALQTGEHILFPWADGSLFIQIFLLVCVYSPHYYIQYVELGVFIAYFNSFYVFSPYLPFLSLCVLSLFLSAKDQFSRSLLFVF